MRILFISPYIPSLIRVRPFQFIRSLSKLGHDVTLVALAVDGEEADADAAEQIGPYCQQVHVVPHSKKRSAVNCALHLAGPTPLWAAFCHSARMQAMLNKLVSEQNFDVAHVEHLRAAHFAGELKGRIPLVFDSVDCITELQSQLIRSPGQGLVGRVLSWEERLKLQHYEPKAAGLFDRVLITSELDAAHLQALAQRRNHELPITVIPNGVDLDYFRKSDNPERIPGNIVFSGKMSYSANRDAALYFCESIFPVIRDKSPGATLTIAGSGPTADLATIAARPNSGIEVTGRVPDLRPYLDRAELSVCPLRVGVGIQNKVLEAMAMSKAVVATPLAARPLLPAAVGESLCVADTPLAFATQILHLLQSRDELARLGASARRYVEMWHNWDSLACRLTALYEDAIGAFAAQNPPGNDAG